MTYSSHIFNYIPYTVKNITINDSGYGPSKINILDKLSPILNMITFITCCSTKSNLSIYNTNNLPVLLQKLNLHPFINLFNLPPIKELYLWEYCNISNKYSSYFKLNNTDNTDFINLILSKSITTLEFRHNNIDLLDKMPPNITTIIIPITMIDNILDIDISKYPHLTNIYLIKTDDSYKKNKYKHNIKYDTMIFKQKFNTNNINIYFYTMDAYCKLFQLDD